MLPTFVKVGLKPGDSWRSELFNSVNCRNCAARLSIWLCKCATTSVSDPLELWLLSVNFQDRIVACDRIYVFILTLLPMMVVFGLVPGYRSAWGENSAQRNAIPLQGRNSCRVYRARHNTHTDARRSIFPSASYTHRTLVAYRGPSVLQVCLQFWVLTAWPLAFPPF